MDKDCIFCRIIAGELPAEKVYEDGDMLAIKDVKPAAPQHVLMLPKKHSANILETDGQTIAGMFAKLSGIVDALGIKNSGFRIVINTGEEGGQTVNHTHIHVLGGRGLKWPPG
ncbi:MAG: HIT domain-containing protein [Acidaminococcales bacterium]|jgi:histidine triad (HIT) family protein|nr:HIT domain-containing protein [Acidaminococcales bacterium]